MPHVELVGEIRLADFHQRFQPRTLEEEGRLMKAQTCFLSHDGLSGLVECVVVEGYLRQSFFVLLSASPGRVLVRLLPRTAPEKTAGIKRCIAWIALWLHSSSPQTRFRATNLQEYLAAPWPQGSREGQSGERASGGGESPSAQAPQT